MSEGNRLHLSTVGGGLSGGHESALSQNHLLIEENQSLRIENDQLRARLSEMQGMNHPIPTNTQPGTANRFGGSGSAGHSSASAVTPINEDVPSRSLSFNLPSLTIGVKPENGGHSQYPGGTPTSNAQHHMHNYGSTYANPGQNRYYSNLDQSPPLLPLTGSSHMLPTPQSASGSAYHRYHIPQNHNVPAPPPFLPSTQPTPSVYQRQTGSSALDFGATSYAGQAVGGYSDGFPPGNSDDAMTGSASAGDGGSKTRDRPPDRISR